MEWMVTITGDHVGYPGFGDLGDFSPRRKILGSKNSHVFWRQIFVVESVVVVVIFLKRSLMLSVAVGKKGKKSLNGDLIQSAVNTEAPTHSCK